MSSIQPRRDYDTYLRVILYDFNLLLSVVAVATKQAAHRSLAHRKYVALCFYVAEGVAGRG